MRLILLAMLFVAASAQWTYGQLSSHLAVYDLKAEQVTTVYSQEGHFEAPNWTPDGKHLIYNADGRLYQIPAEGGAPEVINTGSVQDIINDHGISPDGKQLAFTSSGHIYSVGIQGGEPKRLTQKKPSYWHGWSPDGRQMVYCAQRNGNFDLYAIPADGGEEVRLTTDPAYDDGPDYSPDGRFIYFNTNRSGSWDIWRIPAEGGTPEQVTDDEYENWFPHPSPDGEKLVFLSYLPGTEGHPANRQVRLRMMPIEGGEPQTLTTFIGGQGTINVASWAPNSQSFAFTYYTLKPGQ